MIQIACFLRHLNEFVEWIKQQGLQLELEKIQQ